MPTWEYQVHELVNYFDADTYVFQLRQALTEHGAQGWEFVSAITSGEQAGQPNLLVFKRPLQE